MFSVRLVKADHYMSAPISGLDVRYSEFRGIEVKKVPVIRIFGSTGSGQKVCLHIHGVFPYIYIPYDGCIEKEKIIYQIASAIDKALNVSLGNSNSHTQHVYKVTHVSAIPFYGYHSKTHQFLKIYFYNPLMIKKASDLLQNGVILGQVFQPHEAHIPFILQFCIDYNLHGMSFVNLASVRYRQGAIEGSNVKPTPLDDVPEELLLPERILRISTCSLEVDGVAADILNRQDISGQLTNNPGLKAIWDEEKERRRNENRNSQFTPQNSQIREPLSTASEQFHLERLKKRLCEIALLNENSKPVMEKSPSGEKPKPYPAPTPEGIDHLDASVLLIHVNSLCHEKDFETTNRENLKLQMNNEDVDKTATSALSHPSDSELTSSQSSVLNSQCLSLVQILQDLIEDNSILGSQHQESDEAENERESDHEDILNQTLDSKDLECGTDLINPLRRHTEIDGEHQQISIRHEKTVTGSVQVLNLTPIDTRNELSSSSNIDEQCSLLKPKEHETGFNTCIDFDKSLHNCTRNANFSKSSNNCSTRTKSVSSADEFEAEELGNSNDVECLEEIYSSSFFKNDRTINISQKSVIESPSALSNISAVPLLNVSLPDKLCFAQCSADAVTQNINNTIILIPKKTPPSRNQVVQSLSNLNLPQETFLKPFFRNATDVVERKEVGSKELKINSRSIKELDVFESKLPGERGLKMYKDEAVRNLWEQSQTSDKNIESIFNERNLKAALGGQRETIIIPCCCAPTVKDVKLWAKARLVFKELSENNRCGKEDSTNLKLLRPKDNNKLTHTTQLVTLLTSSQEVTEYESTRSSAHFQLDESVSIPLSTKEIASDSVLKANDCLKLNSHISDDIYKEGEKQENSQNSTCVFDATMLHASSSLCIQKVTDNSNSSVGNLLAQTQFQQQLTTPQTGKSHDSLGFKMSYENLQDCRAVVEPQYLTLLAIELHIQTRGNLRPDPAHDSVCAVFYCVQNDVPKESLVPNFNSGMIVVRDSSFKKVSLIHNTDVNCKTSYVSNEKALMEEVIHLVQLWDPDILVGYEVERHSWGYLIERAYVLEMNLCPLISRIPGARQGNKLSLDESVMELPEEFSLLGRIILNVWRLMRHEVALQSYTFENVSFHVLHERIPLVSFKTLTQWWGHRTRYFWGRVADHYLLRVRGLIRILEQLDLINRTSELARIFGIQFYEVLSRGSQFRVESMMLRLAKPLNYVPVSPSIQQRARMRAPEYLQLIMEPESQIYVDPVIVLDFQSLYPSMIIAYNYCFSTCLGRIEYIGKASPFEFGSSHLQVPPEQVKHLLGNLNISPSGEAFVNATVRKGIMPRMLEEILETRLMVKKSMKEHKDDKTLQRVLHSRQLGLKLIANVTYGYTAANFSGRMACVEIADSVVSKGRETLERAIHLVENTSQWGARVVYGDTDSLFVLVPGRSRKDAFVIGAEIVEAVTKDNPSPVKLKLEKVYQPCILQTKKRYVGYMYESASQREPVFEAKGIETIRRDGCPAVAKVLEKSLRLLFETKDVSKVKVYVQRKFSQLLEGQMSIQDLIFAREYRGQGGYKPGACVPALELTKRWLMVDPRAEPRVSERVPYVVISGAPNVPLIQLVRSPHELLEEPGLKVHAHYYVSRVLCPPLARCFSLLGADILSWYTDLPRRMVLSLPKSVPVKEHKKLTISQYFSTSNCAVCHQICQVGICSDCQKQPQLTAVTLAEKLHQWERHYYNLEKICQSCCRYFDQIECISLDCPVMYYRSQAKHTMLQEPFILNLQENLQH